ncbi:MAG: hypothetical protein ACRDPX_07470, partial [Gaiellaceae bacterium]
MLSTFVKLAVIATLAAVSAMAATASGGQAQATASAAEYTLDQSRGLVGSFDGFGGQLNQHLYARISGPPPGLANVEAKVVAL